MTDDRAPAAEASMREEGIPKPGFLHQTSTAALETEKPSPALSWLLEQPGVKERLAKGQMFNAYDGHRCAHIGIGPVSDFLGLANTVSLEMAEAFVDALRLSAGQKPLVSSIAALAMEKNDA